MWKSSVNLKHAVTALGLSLLLSGTGLAAPVSEAEMEALRSAPKEKAARIAQKIETTWARSGSATMDLLLQRGRDAIEEGDYTAAIEHLTALTDHAPDFAEGYHQRAQAFYRADLLGPAMDDLEMTLALNPQHYNAIFGFGILARDFGNLVRAEQLFRQTLALHPHHENAQSALERLRRDGIGREL